MAYFRYGFQIILCVIFFIAFLMGTTQATTVAVRYIGNAALFGSVISTPCSIAMKSEDQAVHFPSLTLNSLTMSKNGENYQLPFEIELKNCSSSHTYLDGKTWTIRFDGLNLTDKYAFTLNGPSLGLSVYILDNVSNPMLPNKPYPIFNSILGDNQTGDSLFLRYFLKIKLTGKPIKSGRYHGIVRFFIDYQ